MGQDYYGLDLEREILALCSKIVVAARPWERWVAGQFLAMVALVSVESISAWIVVWIFAADTDPSPLDLPDVFPPLGRFKLSLHLKDRLPLHQIRLLIKLFFCCCSLSSDTSTKIHFCTEPSSLCWIRVVTLL